MGLRAGATGQPQRCCSCCCADLGDYVDLVCGEVRSRVLQISVAAGMFHIFLATFLLGNNYVEVDGLLVPDDGCGLSGGEVLCKEGKLACLLQQSVLEPLVQWLRVLLPLTLLTVNSPRYRGKCAMLMIAWTTFTSFTRVLALVGGFWDVISFLADTDAIEALFSTSDSPCQPPLRRYMDFDDRYCKSGALLGFYHAVDVANNITFLTPPYRSVVVYPVAVFSVNFLELLQQTGVFVGMLVVVATWFSCLEQHASAQAARHALYWDHVRRLLRGKGAPPAPAADTGGEAKLIPLLDEDEDADGADPASGETSSAMEALQATPVLTNPHMLLGVAMGSGAVIWSLIGLLIFMVVGMVLLNVLPNIIDDSGSGEDPEWLQRAEAANRTAAGMLGSFEQLYRLAQELLVATNTSSKKVEKAGEYYNIFHKDYDLSVQVFNTFVAHKQYYKASTWLKFTGKFLVPLCVCAGVNSFILTLGWGVWVLTASSEAFRRDVRLSRLLGFRAVFGDSQLSILTLTDAGYFPSAMATQVLVGALSLFVFVSLPLSVAFFITCLAPAPEPISDTPVRDWFWSYLLKSAWLWIAVASAIIGYLVRYVVTLKVQNGYVILSRSYYAIFEVWLMFTGIFASLFAALVKLIVPVVLLRLLYFARPDMCAYPRGWETFDAAHRAYVAAVWIDVLHNNPVVYAFSKIVQHRAATGQPPSVPLGDADILHLGRDPRLDHGQDQQRAPAPHSAVSAAASAVLLPGGKAATEMSTRRPRARGAFYWWLLVTLERNPTLRGDRKHRCQDRLLLQGVLQQRVVKLWIPRLAVLSASALVLHEMEGSETRGAVLSQARDRLSGCCGPLRTSARHAWGVLREALGFGIAPEPAGAGEAQHAGAAGAREPAAGTWAAGRPDGSMESLRVELDEHTDLSASDPAALTLRLRRRFRSLDAARDVRDRTTALALLSSGDRSQVELRCASAAGYSEWAAALEQCCATLREDRDLRREVRELRAEVARLRAAGGAARQESARLTPLPSASISGAPAQPVEAAT
eukprot:TRINITY_DN43203_c0_g1_i1.p1 TRINITY_DN43203_c0_g1~~TRINITY_DN43203_c0_g1_i1.p1  ORF type:complete len:1051 (+),score=358.36 TRINITY_DN43203_c0_g1_i1:57-3155(+)